MLIPEPQFQTIQKSCRVRLTQDWRVELEDGLIIVVPKGFTTDGASVPRLLWPILSPLGDLRYGAIVHDFGYQHGYLLSEYDSSKVYPRRAIAFRREHRLLFSDYVPMFVFSDQEFFDALFRDIVIAATRVSWKARLAYGILRVFGRFAWNRYRRLGPAAYNTNSLYLPGE